MKLSRLEKLRDGRYGGRSIEEFGRFGDELISRGVGGGT